MKPIENIAIVGFGSLGAMYAGCFGAAMGPERVFVVADTARTERYRAEAPTFNGEPIRVTYLNYDEADERAAEDPFDVVLYAVKYGALPEAIEQSAPLVGPDTAIISVLNGVTSEEVSVMGMEQQAPVISETNKIDTNFVPHLHFLGNYAMIRNTLPGQKGGPYEENF